jgi:hypothetical protein
MSVHVGIASLRSSARLARLLLKSHTGIVLNDHYVGDGDIIQARLRGHHVEAARLAVPLRPIAATGARQPGPAMGGALQSVQPAGEGIKVS